MDYVVLVDENDRETGIMEKLQAHIEGRLHRAISVFLFNTKGALLLQRRALGKYHSAGLWTNTCCSHPKPGEATSAAAVRRLKEEMGIECSISEVHQFVYKAGFENGLTEYEFDHVFTGVTDQIPAPDPEEVMEWKYISKEALLQDMERNPEDYTAWFRICMREVPAFAHAV